jgi:hypothetical protein
MCHGSKNTNLSSLIDNNIQLKSSIMIQDNVTRLAAQQEELVNALKDRGMQRDIRRRANAGEMVRRTKQGTWEQERTERVVNEATSTMLPVPLIGTMISRPKTYLVTLCTCL